ncbi:FecCD family ABC transporter permease [Aeromicrobium piscarium]|uniref:Iron chelate uptake ABC transporter family permease subunit n=1 Tax=Aeromicrobium piscarium TaxID=2590901 RepID=A0A554S747_9ACTN|nr:iron chelate uptake ABC transporter family permease subunit [Aeromicrobium piscarium]TSD62125.1 iron chelate uptake ABC transporter family permease subunit [Aeromicrobium piscarium]
MPPSSPPATGRSSVRGRRQTVIVLALLALVVAAAVSIAVGAESLSVRRVIEALWGSPDDPTATTIVRETRVPRMVAAIVVGAGLAVAGAVIQALTRNPLADPGILGVSAGSAFTVALGVGFLGVSGTLATLPFAFAGALVTALAVFAIGGSGTSSARLVLAGVAFGSVLAGVTRAIVLADPKAFNTMRVWNAGSLEGRGWEHAAPVIAFILLGLVMAMAITPSLNATALGDDTARALGARLFRTRVVALLCITLLAGSATAVAGPIVFVGLMIPHAARALVGLDQRWIIGVSAVLGPVLVLASDILGRVALPNGELPVGVVTAFVGAPVLIAIVRRRQVVSL